jgi:hypothetical protein
VVDGQLGQALVLVPGRGPPVEGRDQRGLAPLQLGQEQLAEQLVLRWSTSTSRRFEPASDSSTSSDPLTPRTASHRGPDSWSSTAVRVRKVTVGSERRASRPDGGGAAAAWPLPANPAPAPAGRSSAAAANEARYSPTGQPPVRSSSSATWLSLRRTPACSSSALASWPSMASWSGPTSTSWPLGRDRASGSDGRAREARASWDPAGRRSATSATASRQSWLASSSRLSRTTLTGRVSDDRPATNRGIRLAGVAAPGEARVWNTSGSIGCTRSRAAAR